MNNTSLVFVFAVVATFSSGLSAQTSAALGGHGRFQTFHNSDTNFPTSIDYTLGSVNWGNGSTTFGVGTADVFTYSQIVQFNVTGANTQTAFNDATEFELSLVDAPSNISFVVYASTVQLRDITFNGAAPIDIMSDVSGSGAVRRWLEDQKPYAVSTPMTLLGTYTTGDGALTIGNSTELNTLLGGTTFDADTAYVYLTFTPETVPAGFDAPTFAGSTLTAVPELSSFAQLLGVACLIRVFRRRQ